MNQVTRTRAVLLAARRQVRIELRNSFAGPNIMTYLFIPVIAVVLMFFLRNSTLMDSTISVGENILPGMLALSLVMGGMSGVANELMFERDDGTLLRMKAIPDGIRGHLAGKVLTQLIINLVTAAMILVPGALLFPSAAPNGVAGWLGLAGVLVMALVATIPLGALIGAAMNSYTQMIIIGFGSYGLVAISGLFYPLTALPSWLQVIGQVFPLYWLGLGFRHATLPAEAMLLEVGGTWRTVEMLLVLGGWAALGLIGAPIALRRMIRGVSGSGVAAARERMLARGY